MTLSNTSGIYGIFCKANGKVYIGGTTNLKRRSGQHLHNLRKGEHHCLGLQELFVQHGYDGLAFKILEPVEGKESLILAEQKWIDFYSNLGLILNECKNAGTTKGRNRKDDEKCRISKGLEKYHALQFKGTRDVARYIEENGDRGLHDLSTRQLKAISSLLRICRYSYMSKSQMIEEILRHNKKDELLDIVKSGRKLEPRPYKRRESTKPEPESYIVRRASPFKNKEFWLISEDVEELKVVGLDDLVLALKSTYPLTLALINKKKPSLNGFYLVAINDIATDLLTPVSEVFFYTFQSPTLEEFNTINVLKLAKEMGLGARTLSSLKDGVCRTNLGWRYLGKTNALTGEFTPNKYLKEEIRKSA